MVQNLSGIQWRVLCVCVNQVPFCLRFEERMKERFSFSLSLCNAPLNHTALEEKNQRRERMQDSYQERANGRGVSLLFVYLFDLEKRKKYIHHTFNCCSCLLSLVGFNHTHTQRSFLVRFQNYSAFEFVHVVYSLAFFDDSHTHTLLESHKCVLSCDKLFYHTREKPLNCLEGSMVTRI